jgi:hypothetical protein
MEMFLSMCITLVDQLKHLLDIPPRQKAADEHVSSNCAISGLFTSLMLISTLIFRWLHWKKDKPALNTHILLQE